MLSLSVPTEKGGLTLIRKINVDPASDDELDLDNPARESWRIYGPVPGTVIPGVRPEIIRLNLDHLYFELNRLTAEKLLTIEKLKNVKMYGTTNEPIPSSYDECMNIRILIYTLTFYISDIKKAIEEQYDLLLAMHKVSNFTKFEIFALRKSS